jgi:hypothetical protein
MPIKLGDRLYCLDFIIQKVINMEKAFDRNGNLIHAGRANKYLDEYTCPCCGEGVFKAEGRVQTAHFRHRFGGKKIRCDLYTQGLGHSYQQYDYANILKKPFITIEESEGDWSFYLNFPKIPRKYTRLLEERALYFKVTVLPTQEKISSLYLRHDSSKNKIRILPIKSYNFQIDNIELANKVDINWPDRITGFMKDTYIFAYVHGEFVMMEKKDLSLHENFYVISKRKLSFHKCLTVRSLIMKHRWYAYAINLPYKLDESILKWFSINLNYNLKIPNYYLDLISPSLYRNYNMAYSISESECSIAKSFRDFEYEDTTLVHLNSDMVAREYRMSSQIKSFKYLEQGYHTFYLKGMEGKKLYLYVSGLDSQDLIISYDNGYKIGAKTAFIFNENMIETMESELITHDVPFEVWKKEPGSYPFRFNETDQLVLHRNTLLYSPSIWSLKLTNERINYKSEINISQLLHEYITLDKKQSIIITNKQYKNLLSFVEKIPESIEKNKLKYFIRLYRNRAPLIVESSNTIK